jgi:hypothetical protein
MANIGGMIDNLSRYQRGLTLNYLFPVVDNYCACGCGRELIGRRKKWATDDCRDSAYIQFAIFKGDNRVIRDQIYLRDRGFCWSCGVYHEDWEADHIVPVCQGGGACSP